MSLERYDRLWTETGGDQQPFGPVHRRQRKEPLKLISKLDVRTVLDVGCGSGDNLAGLAHAMPHLALSGVDISGEALALAAQRLPGASFRVLGAQKGRIDERFNLVMCKQMIEHLIDDMAALRNMTLMAKQWY
jgi:ubiquinone/menaquinone biosynthesis C-methylase UbiE